MWKALLAGLALAAATAQSRSGSVATARRPRALGGDLMRFNPDLGAIQQRAEPFWGDVLASWSPEFLARLGAPVAKTWGERGRRSSRTT